MSELRSCSCKCADISPNCTVDSVMARHPWVLPVLNAFGIDTCCGGASTLESAAKHAHIQPALLVEALKRAVSP